MSQNVPIRTTGHQWDFLEPAMHPSYARTKHGVIVPAGSGLYVRYPKGQVIRQKNDGTNAWAKIGTSGFAGPPMLVKYPFVVNDAGEWQITDDATFNGNYETFRDSIAFYYQGYFRTQDITSQGGTNEVQTLTFDTDVDGGTFTVSFGPYTTAAIAWNATAAAIKTAMLLAMPNLVTGDLTASGSAGGPHTFTFTGAYAGTNVPLMVINIAGLTDGGVAVTGDSTAVVETTPGAGLLSGVGRLVQGTASDGIFQLGAATPV
jgi:hypothetical protein